MTKKNRVWILYRESDAAQNSFFIAKTAAAFEKRGIRVFLFCVKDGNSEKLSEDFCAGLETIFVDNPDKFENILKNIDFLPLAAVNRIPSPDYSEIAERAGIKVFNDSSVSKLLNDKYATFAFARRLFPMAETVLCYSADEAAKLGFPLVLKNPSGRGGSEVFLISDYEELKMRFKKGYIAQEYIANAFGDLRVYVLGGEIAAAVLRERGNDFRANVKQGGRARLFEPPQEIVSFAEKFARKIKADYIGVDFLALEDGKFLFNEAEDCVGARSLYALTDLDAADMLAKLVCETCLGAGEKTGGNK